MARTLEEMATKGRTKLSAKLDLMAQNWEAAKSRMISHYEDLPFNARIKEAYRQGVQAASYRKPDPNKWAENWVAKVG